MMPDILFIGISIMAYLRITVSQGTEMNNVGIASMMTGHAPTDVARWAGLLGVIFLLIRALLRR